MTDRAWGTGTMAATAVIDLGVLDREEPDLFAESGVIRRPAPLFVVAFVLTWCVIGLTGAVAAPPTPLLLVSVTAVLDPPRLAGDLLLAQIDDPQGSLLTAFGLGDGAIRWQYRPDVRMATLSTGPVVLVTPFFCRGLQTFATQALDAGDGSELWKLAGAPLWPVADSDLIVFKQPISGCTEATAGFDPLPAMPFTWLGVDPASGGVAWSFTVPAGASVAAGLDPRGRASWLAVLAAGLLRTYDLHTGAELARLPAPPDPFSPDLLRVLGGGDRVLLAERVTGAMNVRAFTPSLAPVFAVQVVPPPRGRLDMDSFAARACGPVICLGPPTETVALDRSGGRERWRLTGRPWRLDQRYGLFIGLATDAGQPRLSVYDLGTGAAKLTLDDAELIGRLDNTILVRAPTGSGRLWRLNLTLGELEPLTMLPSFYSDCDAGGRYLACRTDDGALELWKLPAACPPVCGALPNQPAVRRDGANR